MFAWLFLSFRKFKQQTSVLHLQQVLARSRGIMPCSNNRNDLSGEPFRKPSPPPTPNNRTAWKKIQATWDACFLGAQASKAQALTLFQRFGPIPWKPDAQWCHAGCCSQAVRWESSKVASFCSSFSYVKLWTSSAQLVHSAMCVLLCSGEGKGGNEENTL